MLAEREGFEPPVPFETPVFKTGAINQTRPSLLKASLTIIANILPIVKHFATYIAYSNSNKSKTKLFFNMHVLTRRMINSIIKMPCAEVAQW